MKTSYTSNPTAGDADELTAVLNEERHSRTLANIARRASRLWEDGYEMRLALEFSDATVYEVTSPKGDQYLIHMEIGPAVFGDYCNCPAWKKYGTCKHFLAVTWKLRDAAQDAAWEATMDNAESEWGCDPHAEY